jgi:hypothetical protein
MEKMRTRGTVLGPLLCAALLGVQWSGAGQPGSPAAEDGLIKVMAEELKYSMEHLVTEEGTKPYFLAYTMTRTDSAVVSGSLGAVEQNDLRSRRVLDVDVRVGDYGLDNTRQIRGGAGDGRFGRRFDGSASAARISRWGQTRALAGHRCGLRRRALPTSAHGSENDGGGGAQGG